MVDFGKKPDFGRGHWIVVWEEKFQFEDAGYVGYQLVENYSPHRLLTFIRRLRRTVDLHIEIPQIIFMRNCADASDAVIG